MKWLLKTEINDSGNEVFSKVRKGKDFIYWAISEDGQQTKYFYKSGIIDGIDNFINVGVSKDNIYPKKGVFEKYSPSISESNKRFANMLLSTNIAEYYDDFGYVIRIEQPSENYKVDTNIYVDLRKEIPYKDIYKRLCSNFYNSFDNFTEVVGSWTTSGHYSDKGRITPIRFNNGDVKVMVFSPFGMEIGYITKPNALYSSFCLGIEKCLKDSQNNKERLTAKYYEKDIVRVMSFVNNMLENVKWNAGEQLEKCKAFIENKGYYTFSSLDPFAQGYIVEKDMNNIIKYMRDNKLI